MFFSKLCTTLCYFLVICLNLVTVYCQHCELSTKDQHQELNQKQVDNFKAPKYVVFSKNQDSEELKHVFESFKR